MSVVDVLRAYGAAFWKSPNVDVRPQGAQIHLQHPGFYETVAVSYDMIGDFHDVDAAVMMTCKPTGRSGYVSCFRREVLVRPCGDALSEHIVASGIVADRLAEVADNTLRYTLGPASAVLQMTFSHLYPLDCVDLSKEYSIMVEPSYLASIRDDDLTRRLSQMQGHTRLRQLQAEGDVAVDRFLIELSAELDLHLRVWEVPEALEFALMETKRRACVDEPGRIARVHPYRTGAELFLRAIQVNEPHLRIRALIGVIESHYTYHAYEAAFGRLRTLLRSPEFDSNDDDALMALISEAAAAHKWREKTVQILSRLIDEYVDPYELGQLIDRLFEHEGAYLGLRDPDELSGWLHDLARVVGGEQGPAHSRLPVSLDNLDTYATFVQWIVVSIMRGSALREELAAES